MFIWHFLKSWRTVSSPLVSQADQDNAIDLLFCHEWRVGLLSSTPFELNSTRCTKSHGNKTSHCIVSKCVRGNIHHATKSCWKRANLWPWASCLGCPAFVLLLQSTTVYVSSSLWLKVNRRIKPVFILSHVTLVILSALARNAAQVLFGCLENIAHTSPAEAWKPLLIMRLWDVIFQSV